MANAIESIYAKVVFAALAFLKQERRTQNMFSDEQPCEDRPFGLVARDDYFGDS